jgi:hypothetical protein
MEMARQGAAGSEFENRLRRLVGVCVRQYKTWTPCRWINVGLGERRLTSSLALHQMLWLHRPLAGRNEVDAI